MIYFFMGGRIQNGRSPALRETFSGLFPLRSDSPVWVVDLPRSLGETPTRPDPTRPGPGLGVRVTPTG